MQRYEYNLKLSTKKNVTWMGTDAIDAARNYVADHPGTVVIAVKDKPVDQTGGVCALNHHSIIIG
jgi:hypothetical protein